MALLFTVPRKSSLKVSLRKPISRLFATFNQKYNKHSSSAVVVGCNEDLKLSEVGKALDEKLSGKLLELLKISKFKAKPGKTRIFHGLHKEFPCVVVAGIGQQNTAQDEIEGIDIGKENVRLGIGAAMKELQNLEIEHAEVDHCCCATAAAEAATLSTYKFDHLKTKKKKEAIKFSLSKRGVSSKDLNDSWSRGMIMAESQNFARYLMELPSNYKTPRKLADIVVEKLAPCKGVEVIVRDKKWIEEKKMGCFLGVAKGSEEPPVLIEMKYAGPADKTVAVVGKGVTFDTGGISIKPSANMAEMKGDMGGAACTVASIEAACRLGLNLNIIGLIALTENMPSGTAIKPGDVLTAMNGKTVEVDNTDAEGRLLLADALVYSHSFKPNTIINLATLTGAMRVALGSGAAGTFTNSSQLWNSLNEAGYRTGDRLWRMPLYKHYSKEMECSTTADLRNTQKTAGAAGSCTAAAFLKEFVKVDRWAHIDIAGVMSSTGEVPYLGKGMSGRPTRTLVEALEILSR